MHLLLVHHGDTEGGPLIHKEACLLLGLVTIERMLPLGLGHKTHKTVRAQSRRAALGGHTLSHAALLTSSWEDKCEAEKQHPYRTGRPEFRSGSAPRASPWSLSSNGL